MITHVVFAAEWQQFVWVGEVLCGGYFLHYFPHFLSDSPFFLHHYLPAHIFSLLLVAFLARHFYILVRSVQLFIFFCHIVQFNNNVLYIRVVITSTEEQTICALCEQ